MELLGPGHAGLAVDHDTVADLGVPVGHDLRAGGERVVGGAVTLVERGQHVVDDHVGGVGLLARDGELPLGGLAALGPEGRAVAATDADLPDGGGVLGPGLVAGREVHGVLPPLHAIHQPPVGDFLRRSSREVDGARDLVVDGLRAASS